MQDADHWTNTHAGAPSAQPGPAVARETLPEVPLPLGTDTDAPADAPVPPALANWLFGPCALNGSETKHTADDPCHTYAIVDASRVLGCVEMIAASDLDHICLYKGKSAEEMADVAPWLVRLEQGNSFTRNLMTDGPDAPPWHMWSKAPALYLRTRLDTEALEKHLRRFNQVTDDDGTSSLLRYWDPKCFEDFIVAHQNHGSPALFREIHSFVVYFRRGATRLYCDEPVAPGGIRVNADTRSAYRARRRERLNDTLTEHYLTLPDFGDQTAQTLRPQVAKFANDGRGIGLRGADTLFTFVLGMCLSHHDHATMEKLGKIHKDPDLDPYIQQTQIMDTLQNRISLARAKAAGGTHV